MADHQKQLQPEFAHDQHTYNKIWLKLLENWGSSSLLKILTWKILQSAPNDPKLTQGIGHQKYPTYTHYIIPRVPNFRPFRSMISCFQDIAHFSNLPLTPMLKFQVP